MKIEFVLLIFVLTLPTQARVFDVDGDSTVGPGEAVAVAEDWKGPASASDEHDHLGQTWTGDGNPLSIRGSFPDQPVIIPGPNSRVKGGDIPKAPLILDNTANNGNDLVLGGRSGIIRATEMDNSQVLIYSNEDIFLFPNAGGNHPSGSVGVVDGNGTTVAAIRDTGEMRLFGDLEVSGTVEASNISLKRTDPIAKGTVSHNLVAGPEPMNQYSGNVFLNGRGEAWVNLPDYCQALNSDFRHQLTPIGTSAPNLYVAQKIEDNRFKIAGGQPNMEVSWMVMGVCTESASKD